MEKLTRMQQRIYDYIAETIREQGYPPSVREIGDAVGLKSPSTVHFHLKHLAELGVIGKEAGKGRAITLTNPLPREDQVPVVGSVAAGSPILAQECIEDYLTFDTGGRPGEFFALCVRGESMINAGILPGEQRRDCRRPPRRGGDRQAPAAPRRRGVAPAGERELPAHRRTRGRPHGPRGRGDPAVLKILQKSRALLEKKFTLRSVP